MRLHFTRVYVVLLAVSTIASEGETCVNESAYSGLRWRRVDESGKAYQCLCEYVWLIGRRGRFRRICKLEGCEESTWTFRESSEQWVHVDKYIRPGETSPDYWGEGGECRCVPGTDPLLADAYTLYHMNCDTPNNVTEPGCQYSPTMTWGEDVTVAVGDSIERWGSRMTCMLGPGSRVDDPYGFFYWNYTDIPMNTSEPTNVPQPWAPKPPAAATADNHNQDRHPKLPKEERPKSKEGTLPGPDHAMTALRNAGMWAGPGDNITDGGDQQTDALKGVLSENRLLLSCAAGTVVLAVGLLSVALWWKRSSKIKQESEVDEVVIPGPQEVKGSKCEPGVAYVVPGTGLFKEAIPLPQLY